MASDSIPNASSIPIASSNPKDFAKKKRANHSAKLKKCKRDARRQQWLSQVKNKGSEEKANGRGVARGETMHVGKERGRSIEKLEIKPRDEEEIEGSINNYSDSESPSNSPTSHTSSVLGSNDSGMNFSGSSSSRSSSSSSSSAGCCSGIMSEEDEEGDDGCLDDWEAMADALAATDDKHEEHDPVSDLQRENNKNAPVLDSRSEANNQSDVSKSKQGSGVTVQRASAANFRAWRPDDAFRPQSLPNLSKQFSFPMNSDRHFGRGGSAWGCNVASVPTSCPICYEDLDITDTSFLPCLCGFRLCLFCHKRILEEDGRCPGCRKQYDYNPVEGEATLDGGSLTFRLARSCSMVTRS